MQGRKLNGADVVGFTLSEPQLSSTAGAGKGAMESSGGRAASSKTGYCWPHDPQSLPQSWVPKYSPLLTFTHTFKQMSPLLGCETLLGDIISQASLGVQGPGRLGHFSLQAFECSWAGRWWGSQKETGENHRSANTHLSSTPQRRSPRHALGRVRGRTLPAQRAEPGGVNT